MSQDIRNLNALQLRQLFISMYGMLADSHVKLAGQDVPDIMQVIYNVFYRSDGKELQRYREVAWLETHQVRGEHHQYFGYRPQEVAKGRTLKLPMEIWEVNQTQQRFYWHFKRCLPFMMMPKDYEQNIKYQGHPFTVKGWQIILPSELRAMFGRK